MQHGNQLTVATTDTSALIFMLTPSTQQEPAQLEHLLTLMLISLSVETLFHRMI